MAKEMNAAQVAEWLKSQGLSVPEELNAKVANSVQDEAQTLISSHLSESDEKKKVAAATKWQTEFFALATRFAAEFSGQEKNVGQGRVFERYIEMTLADGSKFAIRHREPREKK